MKTYLFFDTESANHYNGIFKMCSLGYILCDSEFNIIESDDLIMNPEASFEREVIDRILYYDKDYYINNKSFSYYYPKIRRLFTNSIIIGHAVSNDIKALNDASKRYRLPYIDMKFYDTQRIYMAYKGLDSAHTPSLLKISKALGIMEQGKRHRSLEDATITMLGLKRLSEILSLSIDEVLNKFKYTSGSSINGRITIDDSSNSINKISNNNAKIYYDYLNRADSIVVYNKLNGKKISISECFELNHFKEMLLIINNIRALGGIYTSKSTISDIFVEYDDIANKLVSKRARAVKKEIAKGRDIEIINLDTLFKLIDYNEKDLEGNYNKIIRKYTYRRNLKRLHEEKLEYSISSLYGPFLNDLLKR